MQTYHTEVTVNTEGQVLLSLPFPQGQKVEILVRTLETIDEEDQAWNRFALENFLNGYSDKDAAYEHYDEWLASRSAK
jgi:hypothetical protein